MSVTKAEERRAISAQAVDEEYKKLQKFYVNRQRIVLTDGNYGHEGGFGIVRRAELRHSARLPAWLAARRYGPPQLVAVKQIKLSAIYNTPKVKRAFTREMLVWSSLDAHPGIAKFLGFYADFKRSEAWLLSPWEHNGNVSEFIKAHNLEIPEKLSLVYDTTNALSFLHQLDPPVCHGDIKSANVLVSAEYKARLCDFGLARLHEDSGFGRLETSTAFKGSIRWCSPELLNGEPRAPTSDVYAWAWLVWEIMTGKLPYEETSVDFVIIRRIFESPLPQVDGQSRLRDCLHLWELMTRCWNHNPQQRPTAKMCRTTITYLPRCTPASVNAEGKPRSAALLENLGDLESWKGNQEKSSAYLDEAMQIYQAAADAKGMAGVLRKKAVAAHRIADYSKLRFIATAALEHCRALKDDLGIADALYHLGDSVWMLDCGDNADVADTVLQMMRESLEIRRAHGEDACVVGCLERIGEILRVKGQGREALSTLNEAVAIASRSGDRLGLANALHMVGATHVALSDLVKATWALSEAISINRSVGWEGGLSTNLCTMGDLKMRLGEYREAEELFQESVSIAGRIGAKYHVAEGVQALGYCFLHQSKLKEAISALERSCLLFQEVSHLERWKRGASFLVQLKSGQGDWEGALYWYDQIIAVCRIQRDHWGVANALAQKGTILTKVLKRYDEGASHSEAAIAICRENGYLCQIEE